MKTERHQGDHMHPVTIMPAPRSVRGAARTLALLNPVAVVGCGDNAMLVVAVLTSVLIGGCTTPDAHERFAGWARPGPSAQPPQPGPVLGDHGPQALALIERARAVKQAADEAVRLDGTDQAAKLQSLLMTCGSRDGCVTAEKLAEQKSKVGAMAGLASYFTQALARTPPGSHLPANLEPILRAEGDVALAETLVGQAMEEARKVNAEALAVTAAVTACASNEHDCKSRCDTEPVYCIAWAARLRDSKPPRLGEAKTYVQKACDAGVQHGCLFIEEADRQIQASASETERLWADVEGVSDDIAKKAWIVEYELSKLGQMSAPQRRVTEQEIRGSTLRIAGLTQQAFCPAKKAFVAKAGAADFAARAAAHCQDRPPRGSAQGRFYAGAETGEIILTKQCQATFASSCP